MLDASWNGILHGLALNRDAHLIEGNPFANLETEFLGGTYSDLPRPFWRSGLLSCFDA